MKKQVINILIVGMALATAWAVRGQFGHEQGAAWAGGVGALALILASGRKDWYRKVFTVTLASAVGWGAGGMMSYGVVVGYGRSASLENAFYGLLMLFVIGSLYGLMGGGLVGLSLDSSAKKKVNWGVLVAEMVAGGILGYYLLVVQLEYLMTPPRGEMWAACLGAGLAMLWHMARHQFHSPIRVALFAALGAGFGFAFGNFLQTIGDVLEIKFNMWNVMEYNIGFWGGVGMAYGVFTSRWDEQSDAPQSWESRIAMLLVFVALPFINFFDSMGYETLMKRINPETNPEMVSTLSTIVSASIILTIAVVGIWKYSKLKSAFGRKDVLFLFGVYLAANITCSYIVSGLFAGTLLLNHHLYWINFFVIFWLMSKQFPAFNEHSESEINTKKWLFYVACVVFIILILAVISVSSHGEMGGAHDRFPA